MPFCPKCNEHAWSLDRHVCPATWRIYYEPFYGDEFEEVTARTAEQAAERWADQYDSGGDYDIVSQRIEPVVTVTDADGKKPQRFTVVGESKAVYFAVECKTPKTKV